MSNFLKRLKLIDELNFKLPITRDLFVKRLCQKTYRGSISIFSSPFEIFSKDEFEFKGMVEDDNFEIRKKRKFLDFRPGIVVVNGTFIESEAELTINAELSGYNNIIGIFFAIFSLFYLLVLTIAVFHFPNKEAIAAFVFIFLHAFVVFGLMYFAMRKSVQRMKYEIERDFFFLTKNSK